MRLTVIVNGMQYEQWRLEVDGWVDSGGDRANPEMERALDTIAEDVRRYMPSLAARDMAQT